MRWSANWRPKRGGSPSQVVKAIRRADLSKIYDTLEGGQVVALEQIDLTVEPGELLTVVGPSGVRQDTRY